MAKAALSFGLPPNDLHKDGFAPIHRATWGGTKGHAETVRALVEGGADVNMLGGGKTALFMACQSKELNLHVVQTLVELGADVNRLADDGKSPLLMLVMGGAGDEKRVEAVRLLVASGADLYHSDGETGETIKDIARSFGYGELRAPGEGGESEEEEVKELGEEKRKKKKGGKKKKSKKSHDDL